MRSIAPLLQNKQTDPGVVTVDESGRWVLSLSGGHQGGADSLARQIAALLGVEPIITSASTNQGLPALDLLGQPYGWRMGPGDWLKVAGSLVRGEPIGVSQTCGWDLWQATLPENHAFVFKDTDAVNCNAFLWISDRKPPQRDIPQVCWHPRTLWIGVGCERGTTFEQLNQALLGILEEHGLAIEAAIGLASLDLKQDEAGLLQLAETYDWPLQFFSASELAKQAVPNPSEVVAEAVGTPSVAEAAALMASEGSLVIPKQVTRAKGGSCSIAVARASREWNPREGKLLLIGSGPGAVEQLTGAARKAIAQADAVIGYGLYLDLLEPLCHPHQYIERSPIGQEVQRAERAIKLARRGLTVAVVSSGDCGIYGMAGLVLECLVQQDWDGRDPQVEVLPGITALTAAAARVGAPLMHDFCAISLSDLLTDWEVIEKRLLAAAREDFAVALYNPRSQTRRSGIQIALKIFQEVRAPETPVILARSVYRQEEVIEISTLQEVNVESIDMLTLLLIGNSSSFRFQDRVVTPRGYSLSKST